MDKSAAIDLGIDGIGPATPLAAGGFAQVYTAEQSSFRREVAVKVLLASELDSEAVERFERECHALGAVSDHPNIVVVHDRGKTKSGYPYIIMELRRGGSLAQRLKAEGPMTSGEVAQLGIKIGRALSVAHGARVLHRDVKPANILLSTYGEPALADFGIARIEGDNKTTSGKFTASLSHAPPEVLQGDEPNETSDVYSLASTMFELFAGRPPYVDADSGSVWALMTRVMTEATPDPRSFGMPEPLAAVIVKALSYEIEQRYGSAEEFVAALELLKFDAVLATTAPQLPRTVPATETKLSSAQPGGDAPAVAVVESELEKTTPFAVSSPGRRRTSRSPLLVGAGVAALAICLGAVLSLFIIDPLRATPVLAIRKAQAGPLEAGESYPLILSNGDRNERYQLVVDGELVGVVEDSLPFYSAEPGRHSVQIEIAGQRNERTNAVELYVTPDLAQGSFRANLAPLSQKTYPWPAVLAEYDERRAAGHDNLKILSSDDQLWWRFFVDGFEEKSLTQIYCSRFDLSIEKCFVGVL